MYQSTTDLLSLPADILVNICSYLNPIDLSRIARVCRRMRLIAYDTSLWKCVNFYPNVLTLSQLRKVAHLRFPPTMKSLFIRGFAVRYVGTPRWKKGNLSKDFLRNLESQCPQLLTLGLVEVYFGTDITIADLPQSLTSLVLRDSQFKDAIKWFSGRTKNDGMSLARLDSLDVSKCGGIYSGTLRFICQWVHMTSLKLRCCYRINDTDVLTITDQLKDLQILDLHGTSISDESLQAISKHLTKLRQLYVSGNISDCGAIAVVDSLHRLEELGMAHTAITDDTLKRIPERLTHLRRLIVHNTVITSSGVASLQTLLPCCCILF